MRFPLLLTSIWIALLPLSVSAQSLKEKRAQQDINQDLQEAAKNANDACGSSITAEYDYSGVKPEDYDKYSVAGYCSEVLSAIAGVCSDDMGKDAVKQKITKVVCKVGPQRTIELAGGTVSYTIQWDTANNSDYISEYLMKSL